jgi:hypothetical protein
VGAAIRGPAPSGGAAAGGPPAGHAGVDVLVGYSGSGPLMPEIAERLPGVQQVLFVDATLPHRPLSADRRDALRALAVDGWLPPWSAWFPPEVVRQMVPDDRTRERFVAGLGRFPLAHFDEAPAADPPVGAPPVGDPPVGDPPVGDQPALPARCAFLRLSAPYDDEAAEARRLGWPTRHEDLDHLAPLTRPATVAAAMRALLAG